MKIISKIRNKINLIIAKKAKPTMVLLKKSYQNEPLYNTRISTSTFIDHPKTLFLKNHIYIGHHNFIEASNGIYIDEGVQITNFCNITSHSSHNSIRLYGKHFSDFSKHKGYLKGEIHIGKYTFVGPYSLIMPNTTIGKGCIIKAYSYLNGEYPDFSIIGGNPAKVIGSTKAFDEKLLSKYPELEQFYNEWAMEE